MNVPAGPRALLRSMTSSHFVFSVGSRRLENEPLLWYKRNRAEGLKGGD